MANINNYNTSQDIIRKLQTKKLVSSQDNQEETLDYQALTNSNFIKNAKIC